MANVGKVRVVYVVDNDASVRTSMSRLMRANGFEATWFSSTQQLLDEVRSAEGACMVVDMTTSVTTALPLKAQLKERMIDMPIIATSVRDDPAVRADAHRIGAEFFLSKPVDNHALLDTIAWVAATMGEPNEMKRDADDQAR